ncbi:MAG: hypothetical protein ACXW4Z_21770, partial [Candidatus Binatia bacterium]
ERLQKKFEAHNAQPNRAYRLSISVGVVHFGAEETSIDEVTARADRFMYEDKRSKNSRSAIPHEILTPRIEAVA